MDRAVMGKGASRGTVRLDCGHMVYWEDFPGTVAAVNGFLDR